MHQELVSGLFRDREAVDRAIESLLDVFALEEVGILMAEDAKVEEVRIEHESGVAQGAATGSVAGATLGAVGASLVSIGMLPAAGIGLVAAGPLAAAANAAVAGAAGGGVLGALGGLAFWKKSADLPDDLERGAVLVSVPGSDGRAPRARALLAQAGAEWVDG